MIKMLGFGWAFFCACEIQGSDD